MLASVIVGVVILALGLLAIAAALYDHIIPTLERVADANVRSAAALENIAESLDIALCDSDDNTSDSTRIVNALEKIAQISPATSTSEKREGDPQ
jgi:archaellum component FlaF (FlaF/FlaG flagellin family)